MRPAPPTTRVAAPRRDLVRRAGAAAGNGGQRLGKDGLDAKLGGVEDECIRGRFHRRRGAGLVAFVAPRQIGGDGVDLFLSHQTKVAGAAARPLL